VIQAARWIAVAALGAGIGWMLAGPALAQPVASVVIAEIGDTALPELVASPTVRALLGAEGGGASLLVMSTPGRPLDDLTSALGSVDRPPEILVTRASSIEGLAAALVPTLRTVTEGPLTEPAEGRPTMVLLVTAPPTGDPDRLGAAAQVVGSADDLLAAVERGDGPAVERTLTSDSTHRVGVVTSADVAMTTIERSGTRVEVEPDGSPIDVVDAPPPVGLYERYLQQRRMVIPIGTAAGLYAFLTGLLGLLVLFGGVASSALRPAAASGAVSVIPLAAALMLVGHLETLTYPAVFGFLIAVTSASVVALTLARRTRGPLAAIALLGLGVLGVFLVEAWLGWTATLTPLLGGAQLDGGRFFGLPNVQIGLLMGTSLYVAQRISSPAGGVALILGAALFAGLPWTGSNIGAAVTIAAAAGLWWGFRVDEGRLRPLTVLRVLATVAGTAAIVVIAHRFLTEAPTHISRFASDTGGLAGAWEKFVDRLAVGADLVARNPFALIPVAGVLGTLWLVLRPPAALRPSLAVHPAWRDAVVTILLGSVIAYVANDSGAAAIGLGFGTALGGLLYVSLSEPPAKMEGS
jgi:hypothetical protein